MSEASARRWVAAGRVQGVGFRWFVLTRAQALGVRGWVRNLADGSVEVVGAAPAAVLDDLEAVLRQGPRGAFVERLSSNDVPHHDVDTNSFHIKH